MTRQVVNERAWGCLPSLTMPCSTFCQMSPLCHPLGLGGTPAAAATMKVGYLPIQLLSFMDPHPAGYIAGSEWGGASCSEFPGTRGVLLPTAALSPLCALPAYSLVEDSLHSVWSNIAERRLVARQTQGCT